MKPMKMIPANMIRKIKTPARRRAFIPAFTLVELLIVIAVMAILAGFIVSSLGGMKRKQYLSTAQKELAQYESALENYKAKYGVYPPANQRPNSNYTPANDRAQFSQLYYELSGTTLTAGTFTTLDGVYSISSANVQLAYGVGGFVNCTKGGGEDTVPAKNFLLSLSTRQYYYPITNSGSGTPIPTTALVTAVGGPDDNYLPLGPNSTGLNPVRYICPGVNNPTGYDLWVQLKIGGKTNLVCNWTKNVQINAPYP
jgi:prepilin-type N-terminal cleavage/methylation domain-containing protein